MWRLPCRIRDSNNRILKIIDFQLSESAPLLHEEKGLGDEVIASQQKIVCHHENEKIADAKLFTSCR